jgi:hypothetical protein
VRPVLPLLDLHGVTRPELYKKMLELLRTKLLSRLKEGLPQVGPVTPLFFLLCSFLPKSVIAHKRCMDVCAQCFATYIDDGHCINSSVAMEGKVGGPQDSMVLVVVAQNLRRTHWMRCSYKRSHS